MTPVPGHELDHSAEQPIGGDNHFCENCSALMIAHMQQLQTAFDARMATMEERHQEELRTMQSIVAALNNGFVSKLQGVLLGQPGAIKDEDRGLLGAILSLRQEVQRSNNHWFARQLPVVLTMLGLLTTIVFHGLK